jgi:hypothetical protein
MRYCTIALLTALLWAPEAPSDVLCPIGGGYSEIVPEDECPERPHKTRERERRGNSVSQSAEARTLEAGAISGPTAQAKHGRATNRQQGQ